MGSVLILSALSGPLAYAGIGSSKARVAPDHQVALQSVTGHYQQATQQAQAPIPKPLKAPQVLRQQMKAVDRLAHAQVMRAVVQVQREVTAWSNQKPYILGQGMRAYRAAKRQGHFRGARG